eukprot:gene3339-6609_t
MCTSEGLMIHTLVLLKQTKRMLGPFSTTSIAVAHCHELPDSHIRVLSREGVRVMDLCPYKEDQIPPSNNTLRRRRSFFCKTAALLVSPFRQSMLVDHDVIWLDNPDKLWSSPAFLRTGTLYFLDRYTDGAYGTETVVSNGLGYDIQTHPMKLKELSQGVTFWRHMMTMTNTNTSSTSSNADSNHQDNNKQSVSQSVSVSARPKHVQDSSVLLLDASRHPRTLSVLSSLLGNFSVGHGDKEIYWISSTVAEEPFAFEPHWPGIYGDCGCIFHFDPTTTTTTPSPSPFFINGQYLVEYFKSPGEYLEHHMTPPRSYLQYTPLSLGAIQPSYGGSVPVPIEMNNEILLRQTELQKGILVQLKEEAGSGTTSSTTSSVTTVTTVSFQLPHPRRRRSPTLHTRNCHYIETQIAMARSHSHGGSHGGMGGVNSSTSQFYGKLPRQSQPRQQHKTKQQ